MNLQKKNEILEKSPHFLSTTFSVTRSSALWASALAHLSGGIFTEIFVEQKIQSKLCTRQNWFIFKFNNAFNMHFYMFLWLFFWIGRWTHNEVPWVSAIGHWLWREPPQISGIRWWKINNEISIIVYHSNTIPYMDVSKNSGTPKWMVYKGKPY